MPRQSSRANTIMGVELTNRVAASLQEIVTKIAELDQLVAEVATASYEQTEGIVQINTAVSQMDKITQANAASAEETSGAAAELNSHAEALKAAIRALRELVEHVGDQEQT